jgi:hypothetical protein
LPARIKVPAGLKLGIDSAESFVNNATATVAGLLKTVCTCFFTSAGNPTAT